MWLRLTRLAAWTAVAAVVFVTLGPLQDRPTVSRDPQTERLLVYFVLGALFAFAYPRRRSIVVVSIVLCAGGLELAQRLTPDRHGEVADALAKALGGILGVVAVGVVDRLTLRLRGVGHSP